MRFATPLICLLAVLSTQACTTTSSNLTEAISRSPAVADIQKSEALADDTEVFWGGSIIETKNSGANTTVKVLAKPLHRDGSPRTGDATLGRFLISFEGFLDPVVYAPGRMLTVTGSVVDRRVEMIDDHDLSLIHI